jgi:hypothetical protein
MLRRVAPCCVNWPLGANFGFAVAQGETEAEAGLNGELGGGESSVILRSEFLLTLPFGCEIWLTKGESNDARRTVHAGWRRKAAGQTTPGSECLGSELRQRAGCQPRRSRTYPVRAVAVRCLGGIPMRAAKIPIAAGLMLVVAGGTSGRLNAWACPLQSGSTAAAVPGTLAADARPGGAPRGTARLARPPVRPLALRARHRQVKKRLALPAASRSCWSRRLRGVEAQPVVEPHERAPSHTQLPRAPPLPSVHA